MATNIPSDGSVTTPKIANGAVTSIKLDPDTNGFVNVRSYGAVGNGSKDDTVAIQNAINVGVTGNKVVVFPPGVYKVSSGQMRSPSSSDWWCVLVPSGANLMFEPGAKLALTPNPPSNTRVLVLTHVSNVTVTGFLEIDGSAATVKGQVNDQLHGLFIYDSHNVYIESVYAHDCYSDNIFVGGLEDTPSTNVRIGYARCETAGRKNFVVHYVDQLHVGTAILNNTRGGAPSFLGENSLDLEPDDYRGSRSFYQRFDYLSTTGHGNDLSAGLTSELARLWTLDIGTLDMRVSGTANPALLSYGVTLNVDTLSIQSMDHQAKYGLQTLYAQYIHIDKARSNGIAGPAIYTAASGGGKPSLHINSLEIFGANSPNSSGVRVDGGDFSVSDMDVQDLSGPALYIFATENDTVTSLDNLTVRNSGTDQVVMLSSYNTAKPSVHLGQIAVFDTRSVKVKRILEFETLAAMLGTTLGTIVNPYSITEWYSTYGNFKRSLRLAGGTLLPAVYIVEGSPEGVLSAPPGSIAMRTDGAASAAFYVKESGTGNTGWRAK